MAYSIVNARHTTTFRC